MPSGVDTLQDLDCPVRLKHGSRPLDPPTAGKSRLVLLPKSIRSDATSWSRFRTSCGHWFVYVGFRQSPDSVHCLLTLALQQPSQDSVSPPHDMQVQVGPDPGSILRSWLWPRTVSSHIGSRASMKYQLKLPPGTTACRIGLEPLTDAESNPTCDDLDVWVRFAQRQTRRQEQIAPEVRARRVHREMKGFLRQYHVWEQCHTYRIPKRHRLTCDDTTRTARGCKSRCATTHAKRSRCLLYQSRTWRTWRRKLLVWYARDLPLGARRQERLRLEQKHPHWRDGLVHFLEVCASCQALKRAGQPLPKKCPRCHKYFSPLVDLFLKATDQKHRVITGSAVFKEVSEEFEPRKAAAGVRRSADYGPSHYAWGMSDDELIQFWEDERDEGTGMHRDCELFFNGVIVHNDSREFQHFRDWIDEVYQGRYEVYRTEWRSVHVRRQGDRWLVLFGSMDLVVRCTRTGRFFVLDYKRSMAKLFYMSKRTGQRFFKPCGEPLKNVNDCKEEEYSVQIGGVYRNMAENELGLGEIVACHALRFHPRADKYQVVLLHDRRKECNMILDWILAAPDFPRPHHAHANSKK